MTVPNEGAWNKLFAMICGAVTVPLLVVAIGLCWWLGVPWWGWAVAIVVALVGFPAWIFIGSRIDGYRRRNGR